MITDQHFGGKQDSQNFSNYIEKFYREQFFPYLSENNIDTVIDLGDTFDRRKFVNFNTLSQVRQFYFDVYYERDIKLHSIVGNHSTYYRNTNSVNSSELLYGHYDNVSVYPEAETIHVGEIDIDLMNRVIGGSFTSRLNMNLREDKSWSYGVRTRLSSRKGPRPMLVYAPVQTDRTIDSIQEIQKEYEEYLSTRPATDEELDPIKQQIVLGLNGQFETFGSLLSGVSGLVTFDRGDDYLNTAPNRYNAVTIDQINIASKKYLDPETWTWFIVGDLSIIEAVSYTHLTLPTTPYV